MKKSELRKIIKEEIKKDFKTPKIKRPRFGFPAGGDENPNKRDILVICECDDEEYGQNWCIGTLNLNSGMADCSCCTANCDAASIDSKLI